MAEPGPLDWAYAAGFVDGEGCIAITRSFVAARDKYAYSVAVVVSNNERVVLDWMRDLWHGPMDGRTVIIVTNVSRQGPGVWRATGPFLPT